MVIRSMEILRGAALASGLTLATFGTGCTEQNAPNVDTRVNTAATDVPGTSMPVLDTRPGTTAGTMPETTTTTEKTRLSHIISDDGVGNIYIGQSIADVDATYSFTPQCGGKEFGVSDAHADISFGVDSENKVNQITVYGLGVETQTGIEIGSRQEEVIKAYPQNGGPTTSILKSEYAPVDVLVVKSDKAITNFIMSRMDGGTRVKSIAITKPGLPLDFNC